MKLARVKGTVWATVKDPKLDGIIFHFIQPVNEHDEAQGRMLIAADPLGSREGDLVYWVGGAEATLAYDKRQIPSDVSIVGLVDRLDIKEV